jgi:hypothetical protein
MLKEVRMLNAAEGEPLPDSSSLLFVGTPWRSAFSIPAYFSIQPSICISFSIQHSAFSIPTHMIRP